MDRAAWEKITKGRAGIRWDNVVETTRKDLGGDQEGVLSVEKFSGYNTEAKEKIEQRERLALRNNVKEKHSEVYGGLREDTGMKTCPHGPMDYAKKLNLRFRVGDLDLPERRKKCTSSREEEDVATNMCTCGTTPESKTHVSGECEIYKEERDALEEMKKLDGCDMEEFRRLE